MNSEKNMYMHHEIAFTADDSFSIQLSIVLAAYCIQRIVLMLPMLEVLQPPDAATDDAPSMQ